MLNVEIIGADVKMLCFCLRLLADQLGNHEQST